MRYNKRWTLFALWNGFSMNSNGMNQPMDILQLKARQGNKVKHWIFSEKENISSIFK